ncbi:hypothetical protein [Bradyrhizobium sp.]|uniref:hypothetical protein n=1 Tax=Bradyrhizobium sp. TaxID=376 RepID=UPI0027344C8D|nr:hypothetical protein [Bradyrhizobium sp.]MDP3076983.1 hypothetical protein [Bradyrhizobium sp.]
MTSVVSLRTFATSSSVPIVVFVDMQQEYLAKPRPLALSAIDRALDNHHEVAYLCGASASHALDNMVADDDRRAVSGIFGPYGDVYETADWIASTLPRKLGNGRNAGG